MTDEEDALHLAALDALLNLSGHRCEADIITLLRSNVPLHPMLREAIADALEAGKLRIHRGGTGNGGRPRPAIPAFLNKQASIKAGQFYLDRITRCGNEKAALEDTRAKYGISEKTARRYRDRARAWNAAIAELKRSRGT